MQHYRQFRLIVISLTGAVCAVASILGVYWLFAATILTASLLLLALRRRTPEAVADERDREIAGASAVIAVQAFAWIGLGAAFFLFLFQDHNPQFAIIAGTLTTAATGVMILFGLIALYVQRFQYARRGVFSVFAAVLVVALLVLSVRLLSGEDDWICHDGVWVMHGHPSITAPTTPCPDDT